MKKITLLTCLFISVNIFSQPFSLIKEINSTATTSSLGSSLMQQVGTTVYFVSNDGISGNELWKSDGTNAGSVMVKDINPGSGSTSFANFTAGDGLMFFTANDGTNGFELWRTDGTDAGTFMVREGFSECTFCLNRYFFHNGILYFAGDDGTTGAELWKTDGTVAGTVLVKDIFPGPTTSHPAPTSGINSTFVAVGNDVYFTAVDPVAGRELFKTDGTEAGTYLVKDILPGANSSISTVNHKAAAFNGKLYFVANDGGSAPEIWATDGTEAGTYLVKDIVSSGGSSQPNNLIAFNGALYFTASSSTNAIPDLWKTDGTETGTVMVRNLVADGIILTIGNSSAIDQFTIANGKLFFRGGGSNGNELYATDGTTAGTGIVKDIYPGLNSVNANGLFAYNNNVYFTGTDVGLPTRSVLYKSDGTAAGTVQLTDGESGGALGLGSATLTSAGGRLFFWGNTNDNGIEPWSTDGTNAITALVKDINTLKIGTPNSGSNAFGTLVHNGYYYYAAVDNTYGNELWKSDGTTAGTVMVKDIWPGKAPSNPAQFFVFNGAIYFTASNGLSGTELWKTDGTEAGTVLVSDINPGPVNSGPNRFFISNNYLYFTAYHSLYGIELWRSDGTAAGTTMVIDLVTGAGHGTGSIIDVVSIGSNAYAIMGMVAGNVLGIPSGSRLIKIDGVTNTISDFASVITTGTDLGIVGNTLYITGRNAANQTLLWKSDNGGAVTQVKILSTTSTNAFQLTNCGGKLYFGASNGAAAGMEPWVSDGTDVGTFMLKDINPGANPSTPYQFVFSGGKVFFTASSTSTNNSEYELWATDGTTGGTYLVKDIQPGTIGSRPNATIAAFGNKVLFTANDGTNGYEIWQSDGTVAGTFLLQQLNTNGDGIVPVTGVFFNFPVDYVYSKLGDKILFFARSADKGLQLYSGSIASPYKYVNDNSRDNDVFTTAVGSNTNNGSQSAPYATLSYAISQASEGDTLYVDAGIYAEQVIINKGITIIGAGQNFTSFIPPATTLVPAPGPFSEIGLFVTTQGIGDVHISNLYINSINASQNIIIQSGGSVKNCTLLNGGQGIFFRVESAVKTVLIENNYIQPQGIGINCQGSSMTATIINNTITNPAGFYAGIFAGFDFGPIVRFTAFGNSINNYSGVGFFANSYNTNITQNSILGTGQYAIQQGTNSLGFATCNWYGTTNAATIASKVSGFFSYTPYLTNGINTNTTVGSYGFIPVAGSCGEALNNFYVNDNNRTNDVFTTAIGSNSNSGTSVAPFATLSYAITVAPVNSVIHVDAGTYAEQVIIDKAIVINGAGKDLANFIKPATALVPAPGPFTEIGLIETTQGIGDVHIRNISVNSVDGTSQNIIIQSGGSVKNCKLLNGGQGVFFRIASGSRYAEVSFNTIQPTGIGINCQGAGLTANIVNNTISNPAGYYAGILAGLDFGVLPQITITNNKISNYFGVGVLANNNSSNITNNSIVGTASSVAIQGNSSNAICNWYGSSAPAIIGSVTYSPFLTNGTDNSTDLGFQPVPGSCNNFPITVTVNNYTNVTCNGANNGNINITVTGGVAPYVFAWTKDGDPLFTSAVEDPTNFGPGTYHLSITDALGTNIIIDQNGNTITIDVTITEPTLLTAAGSGTNVSCFNGTNGTASVLVNGGTAPYTYLWSNGATTNEINNLSAGTYMVTVTDANGCTANATYIVTQPTALSITVTGTIATCNGSANATVSGGTLPYTYLWNNGAITQAISNVPAGTYSVVVTDANGCSISGSFTINGSSTINPTTTLVAVNCFGESNGSITITGATNGTVPYTYNLNGTPFQTINVFNNLSAGTYVVGIKDANGCSDFVNRIITQPAAPLTVALDSTITPCSGASNGRIYITANGGNAGRTYNWTGPNGYTSTARNPNNIAAGQYNVIVTDSKGCTASLGVTLTAWPDINISEVVTNVGCRGALTGAIDVTTSGGTGSGFTFSWNGPGTLVLPATEDISGVRFGSYTLTVTDIGSGCELVKTIVITQPATSVNVTAPNPSNIITCGGSTTITATGSGGTAPYEYSLDGGPYQAGNTFTIFTVGVHTVTVRDVNGCTKTISKTVTDSGSDPYETNNSKNQSKQIGLGTIIDARIGTASDAADWFRFTTNAAGIYTLTLTHPSINYSFNVYTAVNNSPALIPLSTTTTTKEYILNGGANYYVQVTGTQSLSCYSLLVSEGSLIVVNRGTVETINENSDAPVIDVMQAKVYPNPHPGAFTLQISSPGNAKAMIQIITADGKIIISRDVMLQKGNSNIIYFEGIRQSVLFYRVIVNNKAITGKIIGPN